MKKVLAIMALLVVALPVAFAAGADNAFGGGIGVEDFPIKVWQCDNRVINDESVQPWRITGQDAELYERNNNYLFEGETYQIDVLVMDKNKVDEAKVDVVFDCDETGKINLNCVPYPERCSDIEECNAWIGEEQLLDCDDDVMEMYTCTIEVPDASIAYGECELSVQAVDSDKTQLGVIDEVSTWFLNPMITIGITGDIEFSDVRPGTQSYTAPIRVTNQAEGGVILDMFITGEDWDAVPDAHGALGRCDNGGVLLNRLPLTAFRYYVENGAYSTEDDAERDFGNYNGIADERNIDNENYVNICKNRGDGFDESMFDECEIIQANNRPALEENIYLANLLYPDSVGMSLIFKLSLPEPCYGEYENLDGFSIYGEAV